ncbi:MAG: phosphate signaling complex protein PhoU [Betaproteobacteria bacterium]|nr:phosphate signaling complex protein PhoU [Betaproteobacteria bacterium]
MSTAKHINRAFDEQLGETSHLGVKLRDLSHASLTGSRQVLRSCDVNKAVDIIDADGEINAVSGQLINASARTISLYQPVAGDMRRLVGWIQLAVEFERLADHAKNICKRICSLTKDNQKPMFHEQLNELGDVVEQHFAMLDGAWRNRDVSALLDTWRFDNQVDDAYHGIVKLAYGPEVLQPQSALIMSLFIAKNLERIGDKISNIAEIYYYVIVGESIDFSEESYPD